MAKPKQEVKRGPKPVAEKRTFVGVILPDDLLERIDNYAAFERDEKRSDAIRGLLDSALRRKGY
jgi:metal-responsive CopG/Arc/MetJ family transcriptional regulator